MEKSAGQIEFIHAPDHRIKTGPVVFLAGPIQGTGDWHSAAAESLRRHAKLLSHTQEFTIASPRRPTLTGMGDFDRDTFVEQLEWEHLYLHEAARLGVTLFWCAKQTIPVENRSYAQTTRFELGEAMTLHRYEKARVVVGIDDGFTGRTYLRYTLGKKAPNIPVTNSLDEACSHVIDMLPVVW